MEPLFWLLLPVAAACGWLFGWRAKKKALRRARRKEYTPEYYQGLSYLLNEQPDKAIEVFIKLVDVDSETIETHLALGGLFRRRGEVERAIRIHQNLIARPSLDSDERGLALLELAKDYMSAGLLDRAESLFIELIKQGLYKIEALRNLQEIYQQEREWQKAISVSRQLAVNNDESMAHIVAHYYCEIADELLAAHQFDKAEIHLKRALDADINCVRASILLGDLAVKKQDYRLALKRYLKVFTQDKDYIAEIMSKALLCVEQGASADSFQVHMQSLVYADGYPGFPGLVHYIHDVEGAAAAEQYLEQHLTRNPVLTSIKEWIELEYGQQEDPRITKLLNALDRILAEESRYVCRQCGYAGKILHWRCPGCKAWGTIKPAYAVDVG